MKRIRVASVDLAKARAKALKKSLVDTGRPTTLSECQTAIAAVLGYGGFKELAADCRRVVSAGDVLPPLAESDVDGRADRTVVLASRLSIPVDLASVLLEDILPTHAFAGRPIDDGDFCHLRVVTEFSMEHSYARLVDLVDAAVAAGQKALAITDFGTLGGIRDFCSIAREKGVRPIVGMRLAIDLPAAPGHRSHRFWFTLLVRSEVGYLRLLEVLRKRPAEPYRTEAAAWGSLREALADLDRPAGLVALLGTDRLGPFGPGRREHADAVVDGFRSVFGDDLRLELCRSGADEYPESEIILLRHAERLSIPVVATVDVRRARRDENDFEIDRIWRRRAVFGRGIVRGRPPVEDLASSLHLLDVGEMRDLFADMPDAVDEASRTARSCGFAYGSRKTRRAAAARPGPLLDAVRKRVAEIEARRPGFDTPERRRRLDVEIEAFDRRGWSADALFLGEVFRLCREDGVHTGPGRGTAGNSAVLHVLGVTDVDPLLHGLAFERLTPRRPDTALDVDMDFPRGRRSDVVGIFARAAGSPPVRMRSPGRLGATAAIDVAAGVEGLSEVLDVRIMRNAAFRWNGTLSELAVRDPSYASAVARRPQAARVHAEALVIEGSPTGGTVHAAEIAFDVDDVMMRVPAIRSGSGGDLVAQFDKGEMHEEGLRHFTVLSLEHLDFTESHRRAAETASGREIDLSAIPIDDETTLEIFRHGDTKDVFQFGSDGLRSALVSSDVRSFGDVCALATAYRPGVLGLIPDFAAGWNASLPVAATEAERTVLEVLADTRGFLFYQEQVAEIVRGLTGWTAEASELSRRTMSTFDESVRRKEIGRVVEAAVAGGFDGAFVIAMFLQLDEWAPYAASKAHAVAYATIAWRQAWLKAHHPEALRQAVPEAA